MRVIKKYRLIILLFSFAALFMIFKNTLFNSRSLNSNTINIAINADRLYSSKL